MIFMAKYKNDKLESLRSLIFPRIENLPEAKEYVNNAFKTAESYVRKVGRVYRKHPFDAVGTSVGGALTVYTGSQLGAALSDSDVRYDLGHLQIPKGATILPIFNNPWNVYHSHPVIVPTESIWNNPANGAGVVLPFLIPLVTLCIEGARIYGWKKSVKDIEKKSKTW
jgi:hypothetical protein